MTRTRTIPCVCAAVALAALAVAGQDIGATLTTLFADGSTNTWTQADLVAALQLTNRKYWRDMASDQGRRSWHGAPTSREYITNAVDEAGVVTRALVETYEDGFRWTNLPVRVQPMSARGLASRAIAAKRARQERAAALAAQTSGVPSAVAEARARGAETATNETETVTVEVEAN